jgi:hypothetical protein
VRFERITVLAHQAGPVKPVGNDRRLPQRRLLSLVGHLEEQEQRQLLDVISVGQPVVAQDVPVIPELLNDLWKWLHIDGVARARNKRFSEFSSADVAD